MSHHRKKRETRTLNGRNGHELNDPTAVAGSDISVSGRWLAIGAAVLLLAFVWSYWPTLRDVVRQWIKEPDYSHGFLVIPLSLLFLWMKRSQLPRDEIHPSIYGALLLVTAALLRIAAGAYYLIPLDGWTIPLWIAGAVWLLFGWRVLWWCLPSIAFLWFMIPIPFRVESWLSVPLQAIATKLSTVSLVILGQPALAEGNTIWIGEYHLFVEEACSGLRIFVGIFALAFAFVFFSRWTWWQKVLVLAAALPIAILANMTRIVTTGLLSQLTSTDAAKQFSHDVSGMVMIPFAAFLFWLFLVYLDRLFPQVESVSAFEAGALPR